MEAWDARRMNVATAQLNLRKYARCEWKCIAFIGTDDWGKIATKQCRYVACNVFKAGWNPFQ